jgi:hypothetical protein
MYKKCEMKNDNYVIKIQKEKPPCGFWGNRENAEDTSHGGSLHGVPGLRRSKP